MVLENPYGMDTDPGSCASAPASCTKLVHGYGDVTAEFLFVPETVTAGATTSPLTGYPAFQELLNEIGVADEAVSAPALENAFVAPLVRFAPVDRGDQAAYTDCYPFFEAELRSINPEVVVALGEGAVRVLVGRLTTTDPASVTLPETHGETLRGRGFAVVPSVAPDALDGAAVSALAETLGEIMATDYRQTKGQQER